MFVLLTPFLEDISDNREWSSGTVAATQLNDRILIAAQTPEGSGLVQQNAQLSRSMDPLQDAEIWKIQADLGGSDRTIVTLDGDLLTVTSLNRTASIVKVSDSSSTQTFTMTNNTNNFTVSGLIGDVIIDVEDIHGTISHRFVEVTIDGIRLNNVLTDGEFSVDLVNGARIEKLPNQPVAVKQFPRFNTDLLLDGTPRVSLILLDLDISAFASRHMTNVHLDSKGELELFNGEARNLIVQVEIAGDPSISPQYIQHWTGDYTLYLAGASINEYQGFGPYGRISGLDGITVLPGDVPFQFVVILQSVEVY
ncbi:MAG: hypothetical protein CXX81_14405 [Methanobacteriota archaeon]|nr:MAG: hypothetical protein CXX81_25015 [Euryarchaeota archaeon]PXY76549.1 MAG: hypothetical protein CXX81_14405 [Euryarchaeota archaeon]